MVDEKKRELASECIKHYGSGEVITDEELVAAITVLSQAIPLTQCLSTNGNYSLMITEMKNRLDYLERLQSIRQL